MIYSIKRKIVHVNKTGGEEMSLKKITFILLVGALLFAGCSQLPQTNNQNNPTERIPLNQPLKNENPDGEGKLYFTVMIHLEGWEDGEYQAKFEKHASIVREYAALFEKYDAVMTLESKEFTTGCINWDDNVLLEMEQRGHGIGLHADQGGNKTQSYKDFNNRVAQMKEELESLGVTVRHISGVCSDKDWVQICIDNGFEATTGTVSYALWSLDEELRPDGFEPYEGPAAGHAAYPWDAELTILPWRANSGADWIYHNKNGELIIIPSGLGLTAAHEETQGNAEWGGGFEFNMKDIEAWRTKIDELLTYTDSNAVNTYYAAWSIGSEVDVVLLEKWLQMIDEYVKDGRIEWMNIPDMIDLYNENTGN